MARVLTAKSVEAMKPDPARRLEVPDAAMTGLYLVVQQTGAKSWAYRYRFEGKSRKMTIGRFPALSLALAREEAGRAARAVGLGDDPGTAKIEAKSEARVDRQTERNKVKTLLDQFDKRHLSTIKSGRQARQFLDRFVLPAWGERDVQNDHQARRARPSRRHHGPRNARHGQQGARPRAQVLQLVRRAGHP